MTLSASIRKLVVGAARKDIKDRVAPWQTNLSLFDHVFEAGDTIMVGPNPRTVDRPTILVFHDLDPALNWGHPCEYLLHDATSTASMPPTSRS